PGGARRPPARGSDRWDRPCRRRRPRGGRGRGGGWWWTSLSHSLHEPGDEVLDELLVGEGGGRAGGAVGQPPVHGPAHEADGTGRPDRRGGGGARDGRGHEADGGGDEVVQAVAGPGDEAVHVRGALRRG